MRADRRSGQCPGTALLEVYLINLYWSYYQQRIPQSRLADLDLAPTADDSFFGGFEKLLVRARRTKSTRSAKRCRPRSPRKVEPADAQILEHPILRSPCASLPWSPLPRPRPSAASRSSPRICPHTRLRQGRGRHSRAGLRFRLPRTPPLGRPLRPRHLHDRPGAHREPGLRGRRPAHQEPTATLATVVALS